MSEEMMIYEETIFTSSGLGGTGFNKSNKKQENLNFTPSPKRDYLQENQSIIFNEIDTYENTPLEGLYSGFQNEKLYNKNIDNLDSDMILKVYNDVCEKIEINNNFIDTFNKKRICNKKKNSTASVCKILESNQETSK